MLLISSFFLNASAFGLLTDFVNLIYYSFANHTTDIYNHKPLPLLVPTFKKSLLVVIDRDILLMVELNKNAWEI